MSEKEKSAGQLLKEKLFRSPKNAGSTLSEEEIKAAFDYCEPYKEFISTCKTEREFVDWVIPVLEKEGFVPDVLVVDPPRTGMELKLLNYLQNNPVKKLIYVSCNPSTLAKNCNHLQKKYHILAIQPLDMFPNTANVETIVLLERR